MLLARIRTVEATESSNDSLIARTEIATDGDVVLVVGPHSKKIRVCSFETM